MYVFHEPKDSSFEKAGIIGKIFPSDALVNKAEFILIETDSGHTTTIRQRESDFIYYLLEGSGSFTINSEEYPCSKGDLVVVPAGATFTYAGSLKMLLCVTPPWKEEQEETI